MILLIILALLTPFSVFTENITPSDPSLIPYLLQQRRYEEAIDRYRSMGTTDFDLLQKIGFSLLEEGHHNRDPEAMLLTCFGAALATDNRTIPILEKGLKGSLPQIQLTALNLLATMQDDHADEVLQQMMASPYLLIRLETAYLLAQKKGPTALSQIESLMYKVGPKLRPAFPQLFAKIGNTRAIQILRQMLADNDDRVRVQAILQAAHYGRDDLLPEIRTLALQLSLPQQEACATAIGMLKDESSLPQLQSLAQSSDPTVRLAALQALYRLGREKVGVEIEEAARAYNILAITILGEIPESKETLFELLSCDDRQVRLNAALALLKLQDPRCLAGIKEILIQDSRDYAITKVSSPSGGLWAWKIIPSATERYHHDPYLYEISTRNREKILQKTLNLPPQTFLSLADTLLAHNQTTLVPTLISLLQNLQSEKTIALLQRYQQKVGAPLVRNYCDIALFQLNIPGPHEENIRKWTQSQQQEALIQFRPGLPWQLREENSFYQLTPIETSRLLIESYEALATAQTEQGIETLLLAIRNGNKKNRYALAGLLIKASR